MSEDLNYIKTDNPGHIEWFIDQAKLKVVKDNPNIDNYFEHIGSELFLHSKNNKILLSKNNLTPKDIHNHALYKIIKKTKHTHIIDCTGGLGRDSLICLYASDKKITTYEKNLLLAASLLWLRGKENSKWEIIACDVLNEKNHGGIWLIDPMFPKHPKTAKSQHRMQIIQQLVPEEQNPSIIIQHAKKYAQHILLKQPQWLNKNQDGSWTFIKSCEDI